MPLVQIPKNVQPRQFEFAEGIERSKPGALYFCPGTLKKITNDELEAIKKEDKRYASLLVVVIDKDKKSRLQLKDKESSKASNKQRPKDRLSTSKKKQLALLEKTKKKIEPRNIIPDATLIKSKTNVSEKKELVYEDHIPKVEDVFDDFDDTEDKSSKKTKKHK